MGILTMGLAESKLTVVGAGFWIRVLARLIDTCVSGAIGLFTGLVAGITLVILQSSSIIEPGWLHRIQGIHLETLAASLMGVAFYHTLCEGIHGATLGKLICGLSVLKEDHLTPCGLKAAVIRSFAYFVDAFFFGLVAYLSMEKTALQQRHGDHWGGTVVVKKSQVPAESRRSGLRFLGAFALGSTAYGVLLLAATVWIAL